MASETGKNSWSMRYEHEPTLLVPEANSMSRVGCRERTEADPTAGHYIRSDLELKFLPLIFRRHILLRHLDFITHSRLEQSSKMSLVYSQLKCILTFNL